MSSLKRVPGSLVFPLVFSSSLAIIRERILECAYLGENNQATLVAMTSVESSPHPHSRSSLDSHIACGLEMSPDHCMSLKTKEHSQALCSSEHVCL